MIKSDAIYQSLLKYDFDLFRGNEDVCEYLRKHLSQYYDDIANALSGKNDFLQKTFIDMLNAQLPLLSEICTEVPNIIGEFNNGHIPAAYLKSYSIFEKVKPYFLQGFLPGSYYGDYYRIRAGDFRITDLSEAKKQKAEMFHIRNTLRNRIGAYRYSIAGYPCLYLSSDCDLAWFECGMPKQFSYCMMSVVENGENALKLIDFSNRPVSIISSFNIWVLNARRQNKEESELVNFYDYLIRYIVTYPIAAACSIKVKDRSDKFVQEYVFPQLFMQWILESDDVDGVRYKSSLNSNLVKYRNAVNVALPVKNFRTDGLGETLTQKIAISDIGYMDINKEFAKKQSVLYEIKNFKYSLNQHIIESEYSGEYVIDLIELCDCIIEIYTALIEGNYKNSELLFTCVNNLCDHIDLLRKNCQTIYEECIRKAPDRKKGCIDSNVINKHVDEFYRLANQLIDKNVGYTFSFEKLENLEHI